MEKNSFEDYTDPNNGEEYHVAEKLLRKRKKTVHGLILLYITLGILSIVII